MCIATYLVVDFAQQMLSKICALCVAATRV
jgi:hypothetical protein